MTQICKVFVDIVKFLNLRTCLVFRSLSRKAIEVVVENGSPFLFTNGFDSVRRLRAFLAGGESNVSFYEIFVTHVVL